MFKINLVGKDKLIAFLNRKIAKTPSKVTVNVGYTTKYAVYVHEILRYKHKPPTQAKFLTRPLARFRETLKNIFEATFTKTGDAAEANLAAGKHLLIESKKIVPVDTGKLRKSGRVMQPKKQQ